ncbi:DUF1461 domain-containing protein [Catenovulum sp. SM1970]|uniref:lipoprotein intramolecular transacylase Lit n=1 Tax=Marinifaba aquimaris TaxID=2741323 RepID=UPI001573C64C|nr:DUF1461 domain-containing protein [Marinifaba aquimaris]NTS76100.1 DUF1461 domain-containing protein [Marinifaba aquimaris]
MRVLGTTCVLFFSLAFAFLAGWKITAAFEFAYPLWYQVMDIEQAIAKFAPQNIYKQDFALTDPQQHILLFKQIADSIELPLADVKSALASIEYTNREHTVIDTLLHNSEIQHLYDVAVLLNTINTFCFGVIILTASLLFGMYQFSQNTKTSINIKITDVYLSMLALLSVGLIIIAVIGFRPVFYQLHKWVFPENSQWFFYYQESLMTTLMQAPYLFAYIGGLLLFVILAIQLVTTFTIQRLLIKKS